MTDFETIARQRLSEQPSPRKMPERQRNREGLWFGLGLIAAGFAAYLVAVLAKFS